MSNRDAEEERADAWLRAQGYEPKRPHWLPKGVRKPDFLAISDEHAPPRIWVEVKSIDEDDSTAAMSKFREIIRSASQALPPGMCGSASLNISPNAIEQSIRWALKELRRQLPNYRDQKVRLVFVQQAPHRTGVRRFEVEGDEQGIIWVRGAGEDKPRVPSDVYDYPQATVKTRVEGEEISGPAYTFFDWGREFECALVAHLDPDFLPLDTISPTSLGSSQVRERTVSALEDANGQLKSACRIEAAPGVVVLAPHSPFADADWQMEQAAIYGKLIVPVRLEADGGTELGEMRHGPDGVFRPDKNTHISAAIHLTREGAPVFFPNPYACHPIPEGAPIFGGTQRANVQFVSSREG